MSNTNVKDWATITSDAIKDSWDKIIRFIPDLIGAIVIVIVGLIIAAILKWLVIRILEAAKVQRFFDQIRFTEAMKKAGLTVKVPDVSGDFVKWLIIIVFLIPAMDILGLNQISAMLNDIIRFVPNVIAAIIILLIGIIIGNVLAQVVKAAAAGIGTHTSSILSTVTRYIIYIFVALAALVQLNIASSIIFTLIWGLVGAIAIGLGLSFGLGGQSAAADLIRKMREDFRK